MRRLYIFGLVGLAGLIIGLAWADQMTFTTYYPAPFGVYRQLQTQTLYFQEDVDGLVGFNYPDAGYDRRLRITAGLSDTANNDQGASIDLHGNNNTGRLDLVAGRAGFISFWTSPPGVSATERMRILNNGNVGIGTTGPQKSLHIAGGSGPPGLAVGPFTRAGQCIGRIEVTGSGGEFRFADRGLLSWPGSPVAGDGWVWYSNARVARLWTEVNGDLIGITGAGNVGIGTTSPGAKLHVSGTPGTDGIMFPDGTLQTTAGSFAPSFESGEIPIAAGGVSVAHGLGSVPKLWIVVARNKIPEAGYHPGDEIIYNPSWPGADYGPLTGAWANSTSIGVSINIHAFPIKLTHKATGMPFDGTAARWRLIFRAWK